MHRWTETRADLRRTLRLHSMASLSLDEWLAEARLKRMKRRRRQLSADQLRMLNAGEPPRCADYGSDFMAWYRAQEAWFATAVKGGILPEPTDKIAP